MRTEGCCPRGWRPFFLSALVRPRSPTSLPQLRAISERAVYAKGPGSLRHEAANQSPARVIGLGAGRENGAVAEAHFLATITTRQTWPLSQPPSQHTCQPSMRSPTATLEEAEEPGLD
jgi:hypothetical protein